MLIYSEGNDAYLVFNSYRRKRLLDNGCSNMPWALPFRCNSSKPQQQEHYSERHLRRNSAQQDSTAPVLQYRK